MSCAAAGTPASLALRRCAEAGGLDAASFAASLALRAEVDCAVSFAAADTPASLALRRHAEAGGLDAAPFAHRPRGADSAAFPAAAGTPALLVEIRLLLPTVLAHFSGEADCAVIFAAAAAPASPALRWRAEAGGLDAASFAHRHGSPCPELASAPVFSHGELLTSRSRAVIRSPRVCVFRAAGCPPCVSVLAR